VVSGGGAASEVFVLKRHTAFRGRGPLRSGNPLPPFDYATWTFGEFSGSP
jgi:hypothetical protein